MKSNEVMFCKPSGSDINIDQAFQPAAISVDKLMHRQSVEKLLREQQNRT
jgi:hypothetical protein